MLCVNKLFLPLPPISGFGGFNTPATATPMAGMGDNVLGNLIKALTDNPFGHTSLLKNPVAETG